MFNLFKLTLNVVNILYFPDKTDFTALCKVHYVVFKDKGFSLALQEFSLYFIFAVKKNGILFYIKVFFHSLDKQFNVIGEFHYNLYLCSIIKVCQVF